MSAKVQKQQVEKCVRALQAYLEKKQEEDDSKQLFEEDGFIQLIIAMKKMPADKKVKPIRIGLAHSLYAEHEVCLFVKDPEKDWKEKLEAHPVDEIKAVISCKTLKAEYSQYQDKRRLMNSYDLFVADDRILPVLPRLLGKKFFARNKHPAPVVLKGRRNISGVLAQARDSTYLYMRGGNCCNVKVGKQSWENKDIVENVMHALPKIVDRIPRKWKNVQSIHLKSHDSVALPIFKSLPEVTRI